MKFGILIALALATTFASSTAEASGQWSISGGTCTVGDPAIQANRYLVTGGSVSFQPTATGLITLYCPVPYTTLFNGGAVFTTLYMTYADTDGAGSTSNSHIVAQLVKLNASNGTLTNIGSPIDSNSYAATSGSRQSITINHVFDVTSYYYVRVDIIRSNTSSFSTLFGISLLR